MFLAYSLLRVTLTCSVYFLISSTAALFFSGTFFYPRIALAIGTMYAAQICGVIFLYTHDQDLLSARMRMPKVTIKADRKATVFLILSITALFFFAIYDGTVSHVLTTNEAFEIVAGLLVYVIGMLWVGWTFATNSYAATIVKIQHKRDHHVIDTGPYAFMRHPMYTGMIVMFMGLFIIMGSSLAALITLPISIISFWPRIAIEERTLSQELDGYEAYMQRVRSRLLPFIF